MKLLMRRRLLPLVALLLGVRYCGATLLLLRGSWWLCAGLLQVLALICGSGSVWWLLRSFQLQREQELLDQALLKFKYYSRYRARAPVGVASAARTGSGEIAPACMTDAGFQLRVLKRLPVAAHLRTSWSLPQEICDEISTLVQCIVKDYISYWFQAVSPNEEFPNDVRFLLADLLGAVASRVLEIDSSQALTMVAKSLELLRLHLGWFREAYAHLAEEHPSIFEGDENDSNRLKRQEYVTAFVQRSQFIHPGVVAGTPLSPYATIVSGGSPKKTTVENAEAAYLRHVATQLLTQLKPQLGQQCDTNMFVSVALNLLREITAFKILKPLSEYAQPRYANEIVLSCLQEFVDEKETAMSNGNGSGMMPTLTLNKLRVTSSFLYKASKRSGEQAEAAFQAMVDAVASAASTAAAGAAEMVFEGDDWTDPSSNPFAFGSAVFAANSVGGGPSEKKSMPSIFTMDDRVAKAAKMMNPRGLLPGSLKVTGENSRISAHMDDLKNAKANIGSSLSKVKNRLRSLGSHQMDPLPTPPISTGAAARMIRKPGQLLQKAWKRGESSVTSPTSSFDDGIISPMSDDSRSRSNAHTIGSLNPLISPTSDEEGEMTPRTASGTIVAVRERVIQHLEKAVANYTKMYNDCPEMRSSARSRELYELLSAIEDTLMLGFRNHDSKPPSSEEDSKDGFLPQTPPLSPNVRRRSSVPVHTTGTMSPTRDSVGSDEESESDTDSDDDQYYWAYLARDRPGAVSMNSLWRFVASQCPDCNSNEAFVSTRGVQWVLVALEQGRVGTFCAELYAHEEVTSLFYESYAVMHDSTLMESVLGSLSLLDKLTICLDVPTLLGRQSDVDQDASLSSWSRVSQGAPVRVLERVWETERYVPINGWVKANDKRWEELPSSEWIWEDEWALENAGNDTGDSSDGEANSAWEYAKTFEDNFHDKEKKFDSVRRRRWIRRRRQLSPVLVLASPPVSPASSSVSSPPASATAPSSLGKARKLKQRFSALKRDKKKEKNTATKRSILKRRSKSFDKEAPTSPITHAVLEILGSDEAQPTSTKTSSFMKARASIPSLRRNTSNKNVKSTATDNSALSAKASQEGDVDVLYDSGDDDNLCFRCLKAFPASKAGLGACQSCHQRVCASCHDFFAFMVFPPPLETSKKARVCGNCYDRLVSKYKLRIVAHVGKYLVKEREREILELFASGPSSTTASSSNASNSPQSVVSPTSNGGGLGQLANALSSPARASGNAKFELTVKVKDDNAYAWSIVKTFHDFEVLEKELTERLKKQEKKFGVGCQACHWRGVDYMEMAAIDPPLRTVAAATLTYEKRLYVLEQFLQQLLGCDTLCQSSSVQKFLLLTNAYGTSPASGSSSLAGWEGGDGLTSLSASGGNTIGNPVGVNGSTNGVLVENGRWRKGRWIAPDANSKETKMRVLQKIEVSLFSVLGELFEFDGIGMLRRQIFSMTRSFIKAFLGASHFRMLERQFLSFTDPKKLSGWIGDLRLYIFPDPADANAEPPPDPDMHKLREDCLEAILASFPSKALSLFGDTACENAALKLHEFLQHEVFVKNLLFSVTDELLLHLFPESTTFQGKRGTSSAPASPAAVALKNIPAPPADEDAAPPTQKKLKGVT